MSNFVPGTPLFVFLLQTLRDEWKEHKNLKDGETRELKLLQTGVSKLSAFLRDVERITVKTNSLVQHEIEIRELIYDLQDIIEMSLTKTAVAEMTKSLVSLFTVSTTKTEKEVKELKELRMEPILIKINNIIAEAEIKNGSTGSLGKNTEVEIDDSNQKQSSQEDQKDNKFQNNKLVEFPGEADILKSVKNTNVKTLDVIAITGMAGIGKSALAKKIYAHEEVAALFPLRIWVNVSEKFNSTNVFREIFEKLTITKTSARAEELPNAVRRLLGKREGFLLVMDDVCRKEDWEVIQKILPENKTGKVIVTTRETIVSDLASPRLLPHHLQFLDKNRSLELLMLQIFDKPDDSGKVLLNDTVEKIAEKCGGVPLIIVVIGGILKERRSAGSRGLAAIKKKWEDVLTNMDKFIIREDGKNLISDALELSYGRLSHDLKLCFLYTGLFPSDDEIPVSTLTQLWIAEGFIPWKDQQRAEKNAYEILETLINKNLVMVSKKNLEQAKTCSVHYMIREFCRDKAKRENLFRVIESTNEDPQPQDNPVDFRRLCFNVDPPGLLSTYLRCKCVRSFLSFSKKNVDPDAIQISTVLGVSELLRVLNCTFIRFKRFPEVKKLMLLKHLALFIEKLVKLPEEISQLVNLQTLIIYTKSGDIIVEANIWKMVRLMRLKTKAVLNLMSHESWKDKYRGNLQTISTMLPGSCNTVLSKKAPYLKTLGVRGKLAYAETDMNLKDFTKLEKLKLVNELNVESDSYSPMVFTKLNWFPPNLKSLTLSNTNLKWRKHMSILAKIKKLEILKLKENAFAGTNVWDANEGWDAIEDGDGFPQLEFLLLYKLRLVSWKAVPDTHFPILRSLVIKECRELKKIPENLPKHLENLEIEQGRSSLVASAMIVAKKQIVINQNRECEVAFKLTIDQAPVSVTMINANSVASSSGQGN